MFENESNNCEKIGDINFNQHAQFNIKEILTTISPDIVIRVVRCFITNCYGPFGTTRNPYKSTDITPDNIDSDIFLTIVSENKEIIINHIMQEHMKTTIVKCSVCDSHSCTIRNNEYINAIYDANDIYETNNIFMCDRQCVHEYNVFLSTKLFTDADMINNICCICIDKLIQSRKLVISSMRTDIFIPVEKIYMYRTKFLTEYYDIVLEYLQKLKDSMTDKILQNDYTYKNIIYFIDDSQLQKLSYASLSTMIYKAEQIIIAITKEIIIRQKS